MQRTHRPTPVWLLVLLLLGPGGGTALASPHDVPAFDISGYAIVSPAEMLNYTILGLLAGFLAVLAGTGLAPFLYPLF